MDTHSPSRLLRTLEQTDSRLVSARGITFAANGMIHAEATELLHTQTPSHVMDAGLRDALGRSACTLQNLVSVETPAACDRLHLVLTGTTARSPLKCLLCSIDVVDDNAHFKTCPATAQHRILRFLRMAEGMASIGDSLHHDPGCDELFHHMDCRFGDRMGSGRLFPRETPTESIEPIEARREAGAIAIGPDGRSGASWVVDVVANSVRTINLCNQT